MYQILFKSRWFAAAWAVATLVSIATFVSEGGGGEKVQNAAADFKAKSEELHKPDGGHSFTIDPDVDEHGFLTDEGVRKEQAALHKEDGEAEVSAAATPSEAAPDF